MQFVENIYVSRNSTEIIPCSICGENVGYDAICKHWQEHQKIFLLKGLEMSKIIQPISSYLTAKETDTLASDLTEELEKKDPSLEQAKAALMENEIVENKINEDLDEDLDEEFEEDG